MTSEEIHQKLRIGTSVHLRWGHKSANATLVKVFNRLTEEEAAKYYMEEHIREGTRLSQFPRYVFDREDKPGCYLIVPFLVLKDYVTDVWIS